MTFTPFHLSAGPHPSAGLLFLPGKKQDASVIAFGMEMKGEAAEAYFHDMFLPEGLHSGGGAAHAPLQYRSDGGGNDAEQHLS